ncbi:hypothetical protein ZWY2020_033737 [Hordeum vulgare]|nr:hypothetical protein ZWY2020_033737 [Hordeum vulgare]
MGADDRGYDGQPGQAPSATVPGPVILRPSRRWGSPRPPRVPAGAGLTDRRGPRSSTLAPPCAVPCLSGTRPWTPACRFRARRVMHVVGRSPLRPDVSEEDALGPVARLLRPLRPDQCPRRRLHDFEPDLGRTGVSPTRIAGMLLPRCVISPGGRPTRLAVGLVGAPLGRMDRTGAGMTGLPSVGPRGIGLLSRLRCWFRLRRSRSLRRRRRLERPLGWLVVRLRWGFLRRWLRSPLLGSVVSVPAKTRCASTVGARVTSAPSVSPPRCPTTLAYLGYETERGSFYFVDVEIEEEVAWPLLRQQKSFPGA